MKTCSFSSSSDTANTGDYWIEYRFACGYLVAVSIPPEIEAGGSRVTLQYADDAATEMHDRHHPPTND